MCLRRLHRIPAICAQIRLLWRAVSGADNRFRRGWLPSPGLCGLPAGPVACRAPVVVVPGGEPWIQQPADLPARGPGTGSVAGVVVGDPRCLLLDRPAGGVVHLRYRQAEPVPQVPEPFAAGPGDRLLQLPFADEIGRAGGVPRRGCRTWCGQAAWVPMIWCRMIPGHCGLVVGLAGADAS